MQLLVLPEKEFEQAVVQTLGQHGEQGQDARMMRLKMLDAIRIW